MCAEVAGGADELRERPVVYGGVCPVSPLQLPRDATEVIIECSRWGIPNNILSMAMAGGSSPVTPAGTLVTHNAEVLAGITLAQLTERGCPVMYGCSTTAMDLKLAAASVGSPELALVSAAVAQLARRYCSRASSPACRATPSSVTPRSGTRRPSPDSWQRWQGPT